MDDKKAKQIIDEIKHIDGNVTSVLVPLLKDTIADYRKIVFKLILIAALLIIGVIGTSIYAVYQYHDFLSQFEYQNAALAEVETAPNSSPLDTESPTLTATSLSKEP